MTPKVKQKIKKFTKNNLLLANLYFKSTLIINFLFRILFDLKISLQIKLYNKNKVSYSEQLILLPEIDKTVNFEKNLDNLLPQLLKIHRNYFKNFSRGFGESIFHLMWLEIFVHFQPKKILEIGVYRGQTLSLFSILADKFVRFKDFEVHGISPFNNSGDSVSKYMNLDYLKDCKKNLNFFNCENYFLHKNYSTDEEAIKKIREGNWDLIYIDGSHEYEIVREDFLNSLIGLKNQGVLVLDDSSLFLNHSSKSNRFWGHAGPSKVTLMAKQNSKLFHHSTVGHNNIFIKNENT